MAAKTEETRKYFSTYNTLYAQRGYYEKEVRAHSPVAAAPLIRALCLWLYSLLSVTAPRMSLPGFSAAIHQRQFQEGHAVEERQGIFLEAVWGHCQRLEEATGHEAEEARFPAVECESLRASNVVRARQLGQRAFTCAVTSLWMDVRRFCGK